jgi:type IV pilus assembly protein PilA
MMLKRIIKNERGLTLIELLAVVVILGIISAIAVPSIGGLIENCSDGG